MLDLKNNHKWQTDFCLLWCGQVMSLLGTAVIQFALYWWLTEKTGSAMVLTITTLAAFVPEVLIGPLTGPLVDRWPRKNILFFANLFIGIAALIISVCFYKNHVQQWMILTVLFVRSVCNSFRWPALQASAAEIVPDDQLTKINAVDFTIRGASGIVGPLSGAFLLHAFPMNYVMLADTITAVLAIIPLFFVNIPSGYLAKGKQQSLNINEAIKNSWLELAEGYRYVCRTPGLLLLMVYGGLTNLLLVPGDTLLPLLVSKHFGLDETFYSLLDTGYGIGTIAGGLLMVFWVGFRSKLRTSITGDLFSAVGMFVIGIAAKNQPGLAIFAWAINGLGEAVCMAPLRGLVESRTRVDMQGRVLSISDSLMNLSVPVAMLIAGPFAEAFGAQAWYVMSGICGFALSCTAMFLPAILCFEKLKPAKMDVR